MTHLAVHELYARRIGGRRFGKGAGGYKFQRIKSARDEALRLRPEMPVIDLGVGEPDAMADPTVIDALRTAAGDWANRGYADNGIAEFREDCARYMARLYGVTDLDPDREINHIIGSKSALAMLPGCFIDPGGRDVALMTVPGYPVLGNHTRFCGGEVVDLPLEAGNGFLPDLDAVPAEIRDRAKILYLNYPNNPTGAVASRAFFERVVEFAAAHRLAVVHDAAYAALTFDDTPPLSFLSVPGAREVGVEIHSLSKAFNMTGWRLGWICGNRDIIRAFVSMKDNSDSGQFKAVQWAGIAALAHPEITRRAAAKYARRLRMLAAMLREFRFETEAPSAGFYLYMRSPRGVDSDVSFADAGECADWLIREKSISTVPWDDAGAYLRLSATFVTTTASGEPVGDEGDQEAERRVADSIRDRLAGHRFRW